MDPSTADNPNQSSQTRFRRKPRILAVPSLALKFFNIKLGLAEATRLTLAIGNIPFEDKVDYEKSLFTNISAK